MATVEIPEVTVPGQLIPIQEFDRVKNAVCLLRSTTKDTSKSWSATGLYVNVKLKKHNKVLDVHCIMTNYHVFLEMKERGGDMVAVFHHDSIEKEAFELPLVPFTLLAHSKGEDLDYVLIRVDESLLRSIGVNPILADISQLPMIRKDDTVYIIQHREGMMKHFSQDTVMRVNKPFIEYYADTLKGSAGSPVFVLNESKFVLVALHGKGVLSYQIKWNKGVLLSEILDHLHTGKGYNRLLYTDAYFRSRQNGKAKNTRIPVIIVGQDRGGKTSLKKHLLGQPFDPEELSTDGIKVDVVELTDENAEDPWVGKEVTFFTNADEAEHDICKCTANLVTEKEQNQKSKPVSPNQEQPEIEENDATSFESKETLSEETIDKIHKLRDKNVNSESPSTTVFVHDFAGQSIFYDTHFCFLKMQCPYLLVVDINSPLDKPAKPRFKFHDSERELYDPSLKTNLDYLLSWLTVLKRLSDTICSESCPDNKCFKLPPVVIALTNCDRCNDEDITKVKKRIQGIIRDKEFENVYEYIHVINNTVSDRNSVEIQEIRGKLYHLCKVILEQQSPMPVRWLRLEVELGDKMVNESLMHITLTECRKVAKLCDVDDVDSALDFLHNRGIIVHHKDSPIVVLDPCWLMNLFTKIITIPEERERNPKDTKFYNRLSKGILLKDDLTKNVGGEHLENLMQQFSLICPCNYKGKKAYIVPSVAPFLEKGSNVQKLLSDSPICSVFVEFDWSYVPLGFYTRFQTSMISRCEEEKLLTETPELFCDYTRLIFVRSGGGKGFFQVYLIKIPAKIKVGVVPPNGSSEQANRKFVRYLKEVLKDCIKKVIKEEPLIYRNVTASLMVKCSDSCTGKKEACLQHDTEGCDRDECGYFWLVEELQTSAEDRPCSHGSVGVESFSLDLVRHWLDTGPQSTGDSYPERSINAYKERTNEEDIDGIKLDKKVFEINSGVFQRICRELRKGGPGKDHVTMAGKMGYTEEKQSDFQLEVDPAHATLRYWGTEEGNTLQKLIEIFKDMKRDDLVKVLRPELEK